MKPRETPDFAFAGNPLDRMANRRRDAQWLEEIASSSVRIVRIHGDKAEIAGPAAAERVPQIVLGRDSAGTYWIAERAETADGLHDIRGMASAGALPADHLAIIAQARSLIAWHERRSFCSNCGAKLEIADAGYRRHCSACEADHFPRTDPVVIMAVVSPLGILLGRQSSWLPGMYSALAGFVEPGETLEEAARREIFEEAGIPVGDVRYVASQPWPYPSSLMIGLIGEALDTTIKIDESELETARWFPVDEAKLMLEGKHPEKLWASRPMAIAWHLIKAAVQSA
ncbi:MAG: NAD(+) diphosphatase [Aestuariivirga sp.]